MPSRRLPNTISAVVRTLTTARDAWKQYPKSRLISPAQWAKLDDTATPPSFLVGFLKEVGDVQLALAAQAPLTDSLNRTIARLTLFVSHFHQVYDFGVVRGVFTPGGRAYYGRPVSANSLPDLASIPAVLAAAAEITTGEPKRAAAEGAAHVPMALPSAAEVAAVAAQATSLRRDSLVAQARTDAEQNEVSALYVEAQRLAVSICNTVEFHLNERADLDDPGRRRIARQWGLVYIYAPSETPDPDDTNAAQTTLETPAAPPPVPTA